MATALNFAEGARRWGNLIRGLDNFLEDELDYTRQKIFQKQVEGMVDSPNDAYVRQDGTVVQWPKAWKGPPIRILTTRLYLSLRGPGNLDKIDNYTFPSPARLLTLQAGGKSEHIRKMSVTRSATSLKGSLTIGTSVPYAPEVEFGTKPKLGRSARLPHPFFFKGAEAGFKEARGDLLKSLRTYMEAKLKGY